MDRVVRVMDLVGSRFSLRARLTLWVVLIAAVIQLAVGVVFYLYQRRAVQGFFNEHLRLRSEGMLVEIKRRVPHITTSDLEEIAGSQQQFSAFAGFAIAIYDMDGKVVASTYRMVPAETLAAQTIAAARRPGNTFAVGAAVEAKRIEGSATTARAILRGFVGDDGKRYAIRIGTPDSSAEQMLALVSNALFVAFPTGVVVAGLCGWFIAGIAVRPLEVVRRSAEQLTPEGIDRRLRARDVQGSTSPEQNRLEEALEGARQRLAAAFAAQERFMSNVSHELKTPIAVLLTEAQTLNLNGAPAEVTAYVRGASEELRRLGSMVDSFLLLTRVREGRSLAHSRLYPVNELAMESVLHCRPMADQYGVALRPHLCEDDNDFLVRGDPSLLRTMIDNLIRNAIRFSPRDGTIDVSAKCHENDAVILVRDRGNGIPEEIIARIFDRFVQAPEERRRGRGHGLGLEIAQGIAELHGGRIIASNCTDSEGGCTFEVRLPRAESQPPIPELATDPANSGPIA